MTRASSSVSLLRRRRFRFRVALPHAFLLQGGGDLGRHVVLVVLGKDRIGGEYAGGIETAFGDDALAFPEEVGQHARVADRYRARRVRDGELHRQARAALHRTLFDETAKPDALARRDVLLDHVARGVEEDDRVFQGEHDEEHGEREDGDTPDDEDAAALLSGHEPNPKLVASCFNVCCAASSVASALRASASAARASSPRCSTV